MSTPKPDRRDPESFAAHREQRYTSLFCLVSLVIVLIFLAALAANVFQSHA